MTGLEKKLALMAGRGRPELPDGFTAAVMERLSGALNGAEARMGESGRQSYLVQMVMAAMGHLGLAVSMAAGLSGFEFNTPVGSWVSLQPAVFILLAGWFILFGVILSQRSEGLRRTVRAAMLGYVWIILLDGALLIVKFDRAFTQNPVVWLVLAAVAVVCLLAALWVPRSSGRNPDPTAF